MKTPFGFHIIKMVDNQPEVVRPLAEVRAEIEDQLKWQKAQAEAETHRQGASRPAQDAADLERVAKRTEARSSARSGSSCRDEPIDMLGPQPELAATRVRHEGRRGEPPQRVARGWVFATVTGTPGPVRARHSTR